MPNVLAKINLNSLIHRYRSLKLL